jgi:FtsP/CotA-like multicopper oxidase with cupredoxin domain
VLLINGQFPGPPIEANWGDTIQVTVHNQITGPEEGTSLHWHGLLQKETPYMDGVPSVQQCPIAPGSSFTYQFKADLYGSSWYHSHYSSQYAGGLLGPMIIHGPSNAKYDIDLGPVFLTDYFHEDYFSIVETVVGNGPTSNPRPASDNNLINGKMNFDCTTVASGDKSPCTNNAGVSKFKLTTGKTHRLRLINAGAAGIQRFSIDGHQMTVIANDFVPIVSSLYFDTRPTS